MLNLSDTVSVTQNYVQRQEFPGSIESWYLEGALPILRQWQAALSEVAYDLYWQGEQQLRSPLYPPSPLTLPDSWTIPEPWTRRTT